MFFQVAKANSKTCQEFKSWRVIHVKDIIGVWSDEIW